MSFSAGLLSLLRRYNRNAAVLVKLELNALDGLSTKTIYASHGQVDTPDGKTWEPLLAEVGPINSPGGFGVTDIQLCTASLMLWNRKVGFQTSGTLMSLLSAYRFIGSAVTIYLWELSHTSFPDGQIFKGDITDYEPSPKGLGISLRQRTDWNRPVAARHISKQEFPRAPDSAVGLPAPIQYGRLTDQALRRPWPQPWSFNARQFTIFRTNKRTSPAVLVDTGRAGQATVNAKAKVLVAGHEVRLLSDKTQGAGLWMDTVAGMARMDDELTTTPIVPFNDANGAGVLLPNSGNYVTIGLIPGEVITVSNNAENARAILDPSDTQYVLFDYTASKRELQMQLFSPPAAGLVYGALFWAGYRSTSTLNDLRGYISIGGGADSAMTLGHLVPSTTPTIQLCHDISAAAGWPDFSDWVFKFKWAAGAPAGKAQMFFFGATIFFRPLQDTVQSERVVGTREVPRPERFGGFGQSGMFAPYRVPIRTPAVTELRGKFYANLEGIPDDGSGTYTGVAAALIERMPDIARHLLMTYGAQSSGQIETGSNVFGSFVDARVYLVDSAGQSLAHGMSIGENLDMQTVLTSLATDAFAQIMISPLDDKLKMHVWRADAPADYALTFTPDDVRELRLSLTPISDVVTGIRIAYDWDAKTRSPQSECILAYDKSVAGYQYRNLRDEYLTVVSGVNDKIDFHPTLDGVAEGTLTPGDYEPHDFAVEVRTAMEDAQTRKYLVGHGMTIVAGYNDRLEINDGTQRTATIDPGEYATGEALALAAQTALNAVSSLWLVAYSRSGNIGKFTVSKATAGTRTIVAGSSGSDDIRYKSGWAALGFSQIGGNIAVAQSPSVTTAHDERIEEHYWIMGLHSTFNLLFQSGVNGADSATAVRHCADLLGFDPQEDKLHDWLDVPSFCGDCPKGNREQILALTAERYQPRREISLQARTIYSTKNARRLRNAVIGLHGRPHVVVSFVTDRAPDIERGMVFGMSSEFDDVMAFPEPDTDGLWAGKRFVVIETEQAAGPLSFGTRIVAVSVTPLDESWGYGWDYDWGT